MRHYEIMLLIHPDQSERARVMMDRYVAIIEGGQGQVHRREDLGRRMLAYPIAKVQKGHYMLMNVECGQETLDELVGALHFSDAVLRHLVVRRDEAVTEQSVLARAAEKEAARENREFPYDREIAHGRRGRRGKGGPARAKASASGDAAPAKELRQAAAAKQDSAEPAAAADESQPATGESQPAADEPAVEAESGAAGQPDAGAAPEDQGEAAEEAAAAKDQREPAEEAAAEDEAAPGADADPDGESAPEKDAAAGRTEDGDPKETKA